MNYEIIECSDTSTAYPMIGDIITAKLRDDLQLYEKIMFIVSGGKTPMHILPLIARSGLDFTRITFLASDERVVPISSPDSTEGMVIRIFRENNIGIDYIGLNNSTTPADALYNWKNRLGELANNHVSVALLGMGEDGHFASFFPGRPEIEIDDVAISVPEAPPHKHPRLTLGLDTIKRADLILLPALTAGKKKIIDQVMAGESYPLSALLNQQETPVKIYLSDSTVYG